MLLLERFLGTKKPGPAGISSAGIRAFPLRILVGLGQHFGCILDVCVNHRLHRCLCTPTAIALIGPHLLSPEPLQEPVKWFDSTRRVSVSSPPLLPLESVLKPRSAHPVYFPAPGGQVETFSLVLPVAFYSTTPALFARPNLDI